MKKYNFPNKKSGTIQTVEQSSLPWKAETYLEENGVRNGKTRETQGNEKSLLR